MGRITLSSRIHCPLKRKDGGGSFRMRQQDSLNLIGKILGHVRQFLRYHEDELGIYEKKIRLLYAHITMIPWLSTVEYMYI